VNLQKVEAPNWTTEQVRDIIAEARGIADLYGPDEPTMELVFVQACQLLGQKSVSFVAEQQVAALDLNHLRAR
jgi:hypothetical protein